MAYNNPNNQGMKIVTLGLVLFSLHSIQKILADY